MFSRETRTNTLPALYLVLLIALAAQIAPAAPAQDSTMATGAIKGGRIRVELGKSHILNDVESYDVTNPSIVSASPAEGGALNLKGLQAGSTTLLIRKIGLLGNIIYEVDVVGVDIDNILTEVKGALGAILGLSITKEGNVIVLEGDIEARNDGLRIDRQIEFHSNSILDLTKRIYQENDLVLLKKELERSAYKDISADTQIARDGKRVLMLRGTVASTVQEQTVRGIAGKFFEEEDIVAQIKVESPQVEIDVEIYTVDMGKQRSIGSNTFLEQFSHTISSGWAIQTGPVREREILTQIVQTTQQEINPITGAIWTPQPATFEEQEILGSKGPKVSHITSYPSITTGQFDQVLRALIEDDVVTNISKQHTSVRSGEKAKIENTEEINLAITSEQDATLETVTAGQMVEITPTVTESGQFETIVAIELSELGGVSNVGGNVTVSKANRKLNSVYVSGIDEKVVLGGLTFKTGSRTENRTPFLGRIPIVNLFFKERARQIREVMNIYFMTLRTPNVMQAEDLRMSDPASEQRESVIDSLQKNKDTLDERLKSE